MRILYGVASEGMGHAVRSAVVARHLQERGHGVCIASAGKALEYMSQRFSSTIKVTGLSIEKKHGQLQPLSTILSNLVKQGFGALDDMAHTIDVVTDRPDVIISDFEPWSARIALALGIPLLAVDSLHFLSRYRHPRELVDVDAALTLPVVDAMVPYARHYFVCPLAFSTATCTHPENTTTHLPILRPEIVRARAHTEVGPHLTIYMNDLASSFDTLQILADSHLCHVWGTPPPGAPPMGPTRGGRAGLLYIPFSDGAFIKDLASCRAVVGSAGALMGEAAALGKPMLALPIGHHWEQRLNAAYLERQGFGESHDKLTPGGLAFFLEKAPEYAANLQGLEHDENRELFASLDAELARIANP